MEINTANDLYKFARDICEASGFVLMDEPIYSRPIMLPRVVCKDGFSVSVQAGKALYSWPREDLADYYTAFELGYPSEREPLLDDWCERGFSEGEPDYTRSVYPFVPCGIVDAVLEKHGGIDRLG